MRFTYSRLLISPKTLFSRIFIYRDTLILFCTVEFSVWNEYYENSKSYISLSSRLELIFSVQRTHLNNNSYRFPPNQLHLQKNIEGKKYINFLLSVCTHIFLLFAYHENIMRKMQKDQITSSQYFH